MPRYFQNMPVVGKPVRANAENVAELKAIEEEIHAQIVKGLENGKADADMNAKGQLTAMQRVSLLVDPGTWCPLNSLYNPEKNKTGTTSIVKGLGRVNGKWCVIIASDNKKHAGTWVPGQADNLLRGSDTAKRLRIPLIYLLECAGVELDQQEKVYPNRRGGGTPSIATPSSTRWASPSSWASTAPTPPAAATTPSAPPSWWPMRRPTWPWAAPASWAA